MDGNGDNRGWQNFDRIITVLAERLSNGWLHYIAAKQLYRAYENGRVTCARTFFMASFNANLDYAIRLLLDAVGGEEDCVADMLAFAEEAPERFSLAEAATVRERARVCRQTLVGLVAQIEALRGMRERRPILSEDVDERPDQAIVETFRPAQWMGLHKAYRDALGLLKEFSGYYQSDTLDLAFVEEYVQDDVDFLMTILSGNCV